MLLNKYSIVFLLLLLADVAMLFSGWHNGHFVVKFLLMPVLIIALIQSKKVCSEKNWRVILAGLVLAWAGDVMLLFSATTPVFFITGLICFLGTHISYIVYFRRYHKGLPAFMIKRPLLSSAIILYALLLLSVLWPHLGSLLMPVIVYTAVITMMVLHALAAHTSMTAVTGGLFVAGAVLFIISDSLLATDKFYSHFLAADILIMITYGVAQLWIVQATQQNHDAVIAEEKHQLFI